MKKKKNQLSENTIALRWQNKAYRVCPNLNQVLYTDDINLARSYTKKEVLIVNFDWKKMKPLDRL